MHRVKMLVTIDCPDEISPAEIRDYMRDAIESWSGQFEPDVHPLFGWFYKTQRLWIRFIKN